jgi:putative hydrolase of the HAD superfamily
MSKAIIWDFDMTIGYREGAWAGAVIDTLDLHLPGHGVDAEAVRPHIRHGFPWHTPLEPHHHLNDGAAWWDALVPVFRDAMHVNGVSDALQLAKLVRETYVDPGRFRVFEDVRPVLGGLAERGWRHVILSNHVPELGEIVDALGIGDVFDAVITSGSIGYEKPREEAFRLALEAAGAPRTVWMIGDNLEADVIGAESLGIPAVLVRRPDERASRYAPDLHGALAFVEQT